MTSTVEIPALYADVLSTFSVKQRLDVIALLMESIRSKSKNKNIDNIDAIYARMSEDWGGDGTPEEIAEEIRSNSGLGRDIEVW